MFELLSGGRRRKGGEEEGREAKKCKVGREQKGDALLVVNVSVCYLCTSTMLAWFKEVGSI